MWYNESTSELLEYLEMANMYLRQCALCENCIAPGLRVCLSHMTIELEGKIIPYAIFKNYPWFVALVDAESIQYKEEKTQITLATQNQNMRRAQSDGRKEKILNMFYVGKRKPKEIPRLLGLNIYSIWKTIERARKKEVKP